jgi:RiboL-PSP-HEPN
VLDSLHQFQGRVEQLRSFLDDTESINALVDSSVYGDEKYVDSPTILFHLDRLRASKINRRVQAYVTGIILLYGLFEQFIEDILAAYIEELNSIVENFADMPEKIKEGHTTLSAQLLINRNWSCPKKVDTENV